MTGFCDLPNGICYLIGDLVYEQSVKNGEELCRVNRALYIVFRDCRYRRQRTILLTDTNTDDRDRIRKCLTKDGIKAVTAIVVCKVLHPKVELHLYPNINTFIAKWSAINLGHLHVSRAFHSVSADKSPLEEMLNILYENNTLEKADVAIQIYLDENKNPHIVASDKIDWIAQRFAEHNRKAKIRKLIMRFPKDYIEKAPEMCANDFKQLNLEGLVDIEDLQYKSYDSDVHGVGKSVMKFINNFMGKCGNS